MAELWGNMQPRLEILKKFKILSKKKSRPQKCLKSKILVCKVASSYKDELHTRILPHIQLFSSVFFFDSKFCLNMPKIAIISQGFSIVKILNMRFCIDCDYFMLPTHRRSQKHIVHMNLLVTHFNQICPQNCSLSLKCVIYDI